MTGRREAFIRRARRPVFSWLEVMLVSVAVSVAVSASQYLPVHGWYEVAVWCVAGLGVIWACVRRLAARKEGS